MKTFVPKSTVAQLAEHLRERILAGEIHGLMPGVNQMVRELGVGTQTVIAAVAALEKEGLLESRGGRLSRRVLIPGKGGVRPLRVRILLYHREDLRIDYYLELRHRIEEAGHDAAFAEKTLHDLGMDAGRVARFVRKTPADAWVVVSGSREMLEWFARQPFPAFALFGRMVNLPIASTGPRKSPCIQAAVRRLVELGHRRIVMMCHEERRMPTPGFLEQVFLDALEAEGIPTSSYNLPQWRDNAAGFRKHLNELFRVTPPTAMFFSDPGLFTAAHQHFALQGIMVPRDISMICQDPDPVFCWWDPPVSHIAYDSRPWIRRIVRWVANVPDDK